MTATEKETSTSTLFKSLFEELHSYFNENSAHKQKSPLSISRYFSLLTLSERDLSQLGSGVPSERLRYSNLQRSLIRQIEHQLHPDLENLHLQNVRSLRKIMIYLKKTEHLLPESIITSTPSLPEIKNQIFALKRSKEPSLFSIPDNFIHNAFSLLKELSKLEVPNYTSAKNILEIKRLQQTLPSDNTFKITFTENNFQEYYSLIEKGDRLQQLLNFIYEELITLQYALSDCVNDELLFNLAFINNQLITETPRLSYLLKKRTMLYQDLVQSISMHSNIKPLDFNCTDVIFDESSKKHTVQPNVLLYYKLRMIIRFYLINPPKMDFANMNTTRKKVPLTPKLSEHLDLIFSISSETKLRHHDLPLPKHDGLSANLDYLQKLYNIESKELAPILNISEATLSRFKRNKVKSAELETAIKISLFMHFSKNFLLEETTIPYYEKHITASPKSPNCYVTLPIIARITGVRLLESFQKYVMAKLLEQKSLLRQNASKIITDSKLHKLSQLINALQENIDSIDSTDIDAITHLLRINSKKKS